MDEGLRNFILLNYNPTTEGQNKQEKLLRNDEMKMKFNELYAAYQQRKFYIKVGKKTYYNLSEGLEDIYKEDRAITKAKEAEKAKVVQQEAKVKAEEDKKKFDADWKVTEKEALGVKTPAGLERSRPKDVGEPSLVTLHNVANGYEGYAVSTVYGAIMNNKVKSVSDFTKSALAISKSNRTFDPAEKATLVVMLLSVASREDVSTAARTEALEALYNYSADKDVKRILAEPAAMVGLNKIRKSMAAKSTDSSNEEAVDAKKSQAFASGLLDEANKERQASKKVEVEKKAVVEQSVSSQRDDSVLDGRRSRSYLAMKDKVDKMPSEDQGYINAVVSKMRSAGVREEKGVEKARVKEQTHGQPSIGSIGGRGRDK